MSLSNTLENWILDKVLRNTNFGVTAAYVSLHTSDPGETGGNEVTGGSYARLAGTFDAANSGASANSGDLPFTNMPAATVTHVGVWDASSNGNFLLGGALTASKTVGSGQTLQIDAGDLDLTIAGISSTYLRNKILDKVFRNTDFTVTTPYVSTHTASPGDNGANESTGGSGPYARQSGSFDAASGGATANSGSLEFAGMPSSTLSHWGIWDASTSGNYLMGGALTASVALNSGDTFRINTGNLDITAD